MASRFVSTSGNDTTGTGAFNAPYRTLGKALAVVAAGDTIVLEPGVYRETNTLATTGTAGNIITVQGDVDGSLYRAAGSAAPLTGEVQITPHTTDDRTQCGVVATLNLSGKAYYTFQGLTIIGSRNSNGACFQGTTAGSRDITIRQCALIGLTRDTIVLQATAGQPLNWTIDRCIIVSFGQGINLTVPYNAGGEYNLNVVIQDVAFYNTQGNLLLMAPSGTAAANQLGYGVTVQGCTLLADDSFTIYTAIATAMVNTVCTVKNCNLWVFSGFFAGTSTQPYLVEDYNVVIVGVSTQYHNGGLFGGPGAHSVGSVAGGQVYSPLLHFGQERIWGGQARPLGMPTAGSPYLNFGDGTAPAVDLAGRNRPEGS